MHESAELHSVVVVAAPRGSGSQPEGGARPPLTLLSSLRLSLVQQVDAAQTRALVCLPCVRDVLHLTHSSFIITSRRPARAAA